jgi:hypothetical protein
VSGLRNGAKRIEQNAAMQRARLVAQSPCKSVERVLVQLAEDLRRINRTIRRLEAFTKSDRRDNSGSSGIRLIKR